MGRFNFNPLDWKVDLFFALCYVALLVAAIVESAEWWVFALAVAGLVYSLWGIHRRRKAQSRDGVSITGSVTKTP